MFQPTRLGRYLLLKKIASGGMAEIFLSKLEGAAGFEKYVIVKRILPQWSEDPSFISMLIDEAKISVQLNHPSIVQIYELGREGEAYFIVMEYVQGVDLRKLLAKCQALKKKIPQDVSLFMACEVLEGLGYAHLKKDAQGHPLEIIHRDISPQNILVSMEGRVKLTDFGIAKAASRHQETMTGVLKGKFAYMSPEQANQKKMDHRSDLYAVAIVLYELLTQERLFYKGSDIETLDRVRRGHVSFSENAEKTLPQGLRDILQKALSFNEEQRHEDAYAFRDDLINFLRKMGKDLRREKVADFVRELFSGELESELLTVSNETRLVSAVTSTAQQNFAPQETQEEILVTRVIASEPTDLPLESEDRQKSLYKIKSRQHLKAFVGVLISITALAYVFLSQSPNPPTSVVEPARAIVQSPQAPILKVEKKSLRPPEAEGSVNVKKVLLPQQDNKENKPTLEVKNPGVEENLQKQKKADLKKVKKSGWLSVQALPWGFVKIDGQASRETPIIKESLSEGAHTVEVFYEPDNTHLTASVNVSENQEKMCVVNFKSSERKIRCD